MGFRFNQFIPSRLGSSSTQLISCFLSTFFMALVNGFLISSLPSSRILITSHFLFLNLTCAPIGSGVYPVWIVPPLSTSSSSGTCKTLQLLELIPIVLSSYATSLLDFLCLSLSFIFTFFLLEQLYINTYS